MKGEVLIHYTFPKHSLSPYLMSGTTLGSGDININKIFPGLKEWGKQARSITVQQRLPGGSVV